MTDPGAAGGAPAPRHPIGVRLAVHTVALLTSLAPAVALVPVYPFLAPILLPVQWFAAAVGGWTLRIFYSVLAMLVTSQTIAMAVWAFTRCATHPLTISLGVPVGIAGGVLLAVTSRRGPDRTGFGLYAAFAVPVLLTLALGLLSYSPGSDEFRSPGCPRTISLPAVSTAL